MVKGLLEVNRLGKCQPGESQDFCREATDKSSSGLLTGGLI